MSENWSTMCKIIRGQIKENSTINAISNTLFVIFLSIKSKRIVIFERLCILYCGKKYESVQPIIKMTMVLKAYPP